MAYGGFPVSTADLRQAENDRGPRYFVSYRTEPGQYCYCYCATADMADRTAERFREDYRQVRITLPVDLVPLGEQTRQLGKNRRARAAAEHDATAKLKAAVVRLVAMKVSVEQAAQLAGVDVATVSNWTSA